MIPLEPHFDVVFEPRMLHYTLRGLPGEPLGHSLETALLRCLLRRGGGGGTPVGDNGCPNPLPHPPQDTRGRGEEESRGRKERKKGGEERRGLKPLTRRYPATQGRRIYIYR